MNFWLLGALREYSSYILDPLPFPFSWGVARGNGWILFLSHLWGCFHVKHQKAVQCCTHLIHFEYLLHVGIVLSFMEELKSLWSNDMNLIFNILLNLRKRKLFWGGGTWGVARERRRIGEHSWRVVSCSGGSGLLLSKPLCWKIQGN